MSGGLQIQGKASCTLSMDSGPYIKLAIGMLVLPLSVAEFNDKVVHNSRKYHTYKACKNIPCSFHILLDHGCM